MKKIRYLPEEYWKEVILRAKNNYGNFSTGEQVEININRAIQEIADEAKKSEEAITCKYDIEISNEIGYFQK